MADGFWNRQPSLNPSGGMAPKRPRSDYEFPPSGTPSSQEMPNYFQQDDHGGPRIIKDTKTIGSAYDRYLKSTQNPSFSTGEASNFGAEVRVERGVGGGLLGRFSAGPPSILGARGPAGADLRHNSQGMGFGNQLMVDPIGRPPGREVLPLPPDASNTLFVEGLPPDSTRREVAHIFRPFLGFKEVRLVTKESKHRGGDPLVLCFVDFIDPACAATALSALQGYRMDEHEADSHIIRLQFARYPGPRSGSGPRRNR